MKRSLALSLVLFINMKKRHNKENKDVTVGRIRLICALQTWAMKCGEK